MRVTAETIERLQSDMYNVYGVAGGVLLTKEHNLIKWHLNSLGETLFNKTYDEYFLWLKAFTTPQQIKEESDIKSLKSMMESCFTYGGISKDNKYIKPYIQTLGVVLFNKVYDEYSKYLSENFFVKTNVHTDHEGVTYNSLIKM